MQRTWILPLAAALLAFPALGCGKIQARAELKKGNSYYQQEQYTKALDRYQKGLELDPDATFAWRSVGLSALAMYRPGDDSPKNVELANTAVDAFEKYLADFPDDEKIEEYLMTTYVNAKKFNDALAFIDRRIQENPNEAGKLQRVKITILTQAGRLNEAFRLVDQLPGEERAVALYSIGVSAWDRVFHDPGMMDYESKNRLVDMGLDAIKRSIDIKPAYFEAMVYYGLLFREKAKLETDGARRLELEDTARQWQQKAIELRRKSQAQEAAKS